jgi:hypothetical protein
MANKHPIYFYEIDEQEAEHAESLTGTGNADFQIAFYLRKSKSELRN